MAEERRRERILRICDELAGLGAPTSALESTREYAATIFYCKQCGHERGQHGNGIVDRRCMAGSCPCPKFEAEGGEAR